MDLEIINRTDNPLLEREQINFRVFHPKEATPRRKQVREQLAAVLNAKPALLVVDHLKVDFGRPESVGYAKHYHSSKAMQTHEAVHLLKRNNLYEGKAKGGEGKAKGAGAGASAGNGAAGE